MKYALLTAINDYQGSGNDLQGCLNDSNRFKSNLIKLGFESIKQLFDYEVTVEAVRNALNDIKSRVVKGDIVVWHYSGHGTTFQDQAEGDRIGEALYLFNGIFTDFETITILNSFPAGVKVIVPFDSCFSGGMGTKGNAKVKFLQSDPNIPIDFKLPRSLLKLVTNEDIIIWSGCGEGEYSYDAYIGGSYNGAFTYYLWKAFNESNKLMDSVCDWLSIYLPSDNYPQSPDLVIQTNKWLYLPLFENETISGETDHTIPEPDKPDPEHKENIFVEILKSILKFLKSLIWWKKS